MIPRELVRNALLHKAARPIPHYVEFLEAEAARVADYFGVMNPDSLTENSLLCRQYWGWPTERPDRPGYFVDAFGVEWNRTGADKDIGVVDHPIITELDGPAYVFPAIDEKRLRGEMELLMREKGDRFCVAGIGFSMFERSWSLMGMENVLISMIAEPERLEELYEAICDYDGRVVEILLEYEVDGIYFGDDWGQQKGLIMGPAHWRRFIKPRMKELYARVKSAGKFVFQHSCGDISEILPDLVEMGLDCYQTVQPEIYDLEWLKKQFGSELSFWGGLSTQRCLPYAAPREIRREVVRLMRIWGFDGGYIAAPTHAVPSDVPPENIAAMLEVFQHQDAYL